MPYTKQSIQQQIKRIPSVLFQNLFLNQLLESDMAIINMPFVLHDFRANRFGKSPSAKRAYSLFSLEQDFLRYIDNYLLKFDNCTLPNIANIIKLKYWTCAMMGATSVSCMELFLLGHTMHIQSPDMLVISSLFGREDMVDFIKTIIPIEILRDEARASHLPIPPQDYGRVLNSIVGSETLVASSSSFPHFFSKSTEPKTDDVVAAQSTIPKV